MGKMKNFMEMSLTKKDSKEMTNLSLGSGFHQSLPLLLCHLWEVLLVEMMRVGGKKCRDF